MNIKDLNRLYTGAVPPTFLRVTPAWAGNFGVNANVLKSHLEAVKRNPGLHVVFMGWNWPISNSGWQERLVVLKYEAHCYVFTSDSYISKPALVDVLRGIDIATTEVRTIIEVALASNLDREMSLVN